MERRLQERSAAASCLGRSPTVSRNGRFEPSRPFGIRRSELSRVWPTIQLEKKHPVLQRMFAKASALPLIGGVHLPNQIQLRDLLTAVLLSNASAKGGESLDDAIGRRLWFLKT